MSCSRHLKLTHREQPLKPYNFARFDDPPSGDLDYNYQFVDEGDWGIWLTALHETVNGKRSSASIWAPRSDGPCPNPCTALIAKVSRRRRASERIRTGPG